MKNPKNPTQDELSLLQLMQDIHCLDKLRRWTDQINIFRVLKIARTEIRHSNMLAWLLDPNENHGLGSDFLRALITDISKPHTYEFAADNTEGDAIITPGIAIDLLSCDLSNTRIFREWNHIDVLLKLPRDYVIAIENKVDATEGKREGKSQLSNYDNVLSTNFNGDKCIKIYLTPDGETPSQQDWKVYTYYDVMSILNDIYELRRNSLSTEAGILIKHYLEILKYELMEDTELKNLCNEIYQKHKQAFDLIFENRDSVTSMAADLCYQKLQGLKTEITLISQKSGVNIKYTTSGCQSLKKKLSNTIDVYYSYEFRPYGDNGVAAKLVLVLHNNNKTYVKQDADIINKYADKNLCKEGKAWEWKGIWSKTKRFNEINDDNICDWCSDTYKKALNYEHDKGLIEKAEQ